MVFPSSSAPVKKGPAGSVSQGQRLLLEEGCTSAAYYYHAGLWQCSLRGWRHGLALGDVTP
jgi:hypothetical protein